MRRCRMKYLQTDRPIAFIDVETTGLSVSSDRIVELSVLKVEPDGNEEQKTRRFNPQIPITAEAMEVHGITDDDVAGESEFKQYARGLREYLDGCDIAGFGVKGLDLPMLEAEFRRAGVEFSRRGRRVLDAQVIYHKLEPRDLAAAYSRYRDEELRRPHSAADDVRAAVEVLDAQLGMHEELPRDVDELHSLCNPGQESWIDPEGRFVWSGGDVALNFGQHRGRLLSSVVEIAPDYLRWIVVSDFPPETKRIVSGALRGEYPASPGS